jgi:dihydroxyacid dehydratase/phosphogluconate dehydratase
VPSNDLLSAHAPLQHYPDLIKTEARKHGATAQVAGGVPAMCDGVTQGTPGMELSLFSPNISRFFAKNNTKLLEPLYSLCISLSYQE